ncbi:DUF4198 domain-containing protein [Hymenobacter saemangeumensis]|uniref:DUF4198 domain-containing protein n=1 Tax=Hymenobacter saemangeumensis TaxID=1084522 RepID=A0ABP8INX4_9BACT
MNSRALFFAAPLLLAGSALAHEFWLEPPRFQLKPGETVSLKLLVGESFTGKPWTTKASKVLRLVRYGPADSTDLTPLNPSETDTLRTAVQFTQPGTHLLALSSTDSFIELTGEQFTAYLREEGLDFVLRQRQQRGEQGKAARETYRRRAKALVQVGDPSAVPAAQDSACLRALGLPLELIPEQNPYRLAAGKALTVRVMRNGKPLKGAAVHIWQRQAAGQPTSHFTTHANQNGRILLRLSGPGPYLLATVDMGPAPASLRSRADWQSTRASLTFGGPVVSFQPSPKKH